MKKLKKNQDQDQDQEKNQNINKNLFQPKVHGIHAVESLLTHSPEKVKALFLYKNRHDQIFKKIIMLAQKHHISIEKTDQKQTHTQGVIAVCNNNAENRLHKKQDLSNLLTLLAENNTPALLLVLDGVQDPHNLGACIRTANASGCHAVIIPKDRAVSLNATVKKVAAGAAEFTPVISVANLAQTLEFLKKKNVWIYGMAGTASQSLYQENFIHSVAFIMGSESAGLRRLTQDCCDEILSIPMAGKIESLNVSVASGICLFEAVRQRNLHNARVALS